MSGTTDGAAGRVLVTGATGMIGGLVVTALRRRGAAIRVLVRPTSDAGRFEGLDGVTVARGDFDDAASLDRALDGVDRAFLLTNSSARTEGLQRAFVDAAARARLPHLVKLSQVHASADSPVRFLRYHAAVERAIGEAGIPFTSVRPNLIMQSYTGFAPTIAHGKLQLPVGGGAAVSLVDARDIAEVAAAALTEDGYDGRIVDVTGPGALTQPEIAATLARVLGREVAFEQVPVDGFVDALVQAGTDRWQAEGLAEDFAHYDRGEAAGVSGEVERVTGAPARPFESFVRESADAFRAG